MDLRPVLAAVAALLVLTGPARAADPVVAAAGDIACDPTLSSYNGGAGTADSCHMGAVAAAIQNAAPDVVLPLGDLQYEDGTLAKFNASYAPTWGRLKSISRPTPGNHEYFTDATGYFDYWGAGAGDRDEGWYSFDVPLPSGRTWHVVSLNSNCSRIGTCDTNSAEEAWLRGDLAAHPAACTLAFSHHPLFSSGGIGNITPEQQLWQTLYDAGVDLVLAGHDHDYERFAPQDPNGALDQAHGLREFIVGTGGKTLLAMGTTKPNSEVRQSDTYGFVKLQLHDAGYDWTFVPEPGRTFADSGHGECHGPPAVPRPRTGGLPAANITSSGATLRGTLDPRGTAASYRFQYGPSRAYGASTPTATATWSGEREVSAAVTGLVRGTTYASRLVASNAGGSVSGADVPFSTPSPYAAKILGTPGVVSYWRLEEDTGLAAADAAGGNPGIYRQAVTYAQPGALSRAGEGSVGTGFRGTGEITLKGPSLGTAITIEGWFNWTGGTSLLRDNTSAVGAGWILGYASNGNLAFRIGGTSYPTSRTLASVQNGWHHYALTKNGAGLAALYVDGVQVGRGTGAPATAPPVPWHVMRNGPGGQYTSGLADEIAIYSTALPADALKAHYTAGTTLAPPPATGTTTTGTTPTGTTTTGATPTGATVPGTPGTAPTGTTPTGTTTGTTTGITTPTVGTTSTTRTPPATSTPLAPAAPLALPPAPGATLPPLPAPAGGVAVPKRLRIATLLRGLTARANHAGTFRATVSVSRRAASRLGLRARGFTLARAKATLKRAGRATLKPRLTPRGRAALKRVRGARRLAVTVTTAYRPSAAGTRIVRRNAILVLRR